MVADVDYERYSAAWTTLRANCEWEMLRREAVAILRLSPPQAALITWWAWRVTVGDLEQREGRPLGLRRVDPPWPLDGSNG